MAELIGARTLRVEDPRLLTGRGRYVDDIRVRGMLHAAFVRSNVAHGRIRSVDVTAARNAPGVLLAVSSADFDGMVGMLVPGGPPGFVAPAFPVLAEDKVRCTGEPIAMLVAESRALAEDACELVDVDIEPLVAVTSIDDALDPAAPLLFEELGTNVMYQTADTYGDPDAAFAGADRIVSERFTQERMANVPLEGRAFLAEFEAATGELTIDVAHQNPHALRLSVAALIDHPAELVTVRCGDIGGSFGQKAYTSREEIAVAAAARLLARPVKWIEDRVENLLAAGHARDDVIEVDFALDRDATILAARVRMWVNQGAYPITVFPPTIILNLVRVLFPNAYRITNYSFEGTVVASNTGTYIAFRGPWESETWARERMIDLSARALGLEPVEVRRRNMFTSADQPTTMVTGPTVAHMTARETLDRACELADVDAFRREQEVARGDGRYLGLGIATFAEAAPGPPNYGAALGAGSSPRSAQQARARLEVDGTVSVFTSQQPHGQGHETTLAQLAADGLGLPVEQVRVVHGDTSATPFNAVGTGGSRSATLASGAVVSAASLLRDRITELFAEHHELDPGDVEVSGGKVAPRGVPASAWGFARVAELAGDIEATADFAIPDGGWTQATHCCWVEVDINTGMVHIPRYLVVEDCGTMINPNIVEGQVSGGVAQGLSTVLYERFVYDDDGQPRAITLLDYLLPTAAEVPDIEIEHLESPPQGPIDFRGAGESGAVGSPAALTNAIEDALTPFGARVLEKYLPPDRILDLVRGHRERFLSPAQARWAHVPRKLVTLDPMGRYSVQVITRESLASLVERAGAADADAWEALYRRAYPGLLAYAGRRLGSERGRDAVAETMVRAVARIHTFRPQGAGFDAWLYGILRHVVLDLQRADYRERRRRVPSPASDATPLDHVLDGEEAEAVRFAFARLSESDQEILELRVVAGLSAEDVGAVLGKKPGAVRTAQSRALAALRRAMEQGR